MAREQAAEDIPGERSLGRAERPASLPQGPACIDGDRGSVRRVDEALPSTEPLHDQGASHVIEQVPARAALAVFHGRERPFGVPNIPALAQELVARTHHGNSRWEPEWVALGEN